MTRTTRLPAGLAVLALVVGLLLAPAIGSSAAANLSREPAPTLKVTARNLGTVTVSGRTARRVDRVVLQRRSGQRWVRVRSLTSRRHVFRTVVRKANRRTAHRVVDLSSRRRSVTRYVPRLLVTRDSCGVRPLKASGEPWRCSFHDDFSGTTLDTTKWTPQKDGYITGDPPGAAACYSGRNVSVGNGSLRLVARPAGLLECPGLTGILKVFTSGMVSTHRRWSQRYGRFEARILNTATTARGLHEAYWLWPDDRYVTIPSRDAGEIDISETYSVYPTVSIPFLHYNNDPYGNVYAGRHANTAFGCVAHRGRWNTYRLEWSASRLRVFVNTRLCLTNTSGDRAFRQRYIMMFTQALGSGTNAYNLLAPPPMPASMRVDYARVWR
ncbi:glycoside hydrolase family 16 protein [Nocardioides jensenii]|uniref:glycoside hydrolase family 16 protein n=1 Tax=Nocardioides jensenii TaxID=1843 RepID=UPI0008326497|nr:glycoside hydrolase family 16 protein [Nocardioides jensenii]